MDAQLTWHGSQGRESEQDQTIYSHSPVLALWTGEWTLRPLSGEYTGRPLIYEEIPNKKQIEQVER
jgi:hypothetical protein